MRPLLRNVSAKEVCVLAQVVVSRTPRFVVDLVCGVPPVNAIWAPSVSDECAHQKDHPLCPVCSNVPKHPHAHIPQMLPFSFLSGPRSTAMQGRQTTIMLPRRGAELSVCIFQTVTSPLHHLVVVFAFTNCHVDSCSRCHPHSIVSVGCGHISYMFDTFEI